jgi:hypothetical protein
MRRCDLKTYGECACGPGDCHQQPKAITAPVHRASIKDTLATAIVIGAIATIIAFISIPRAVGASHQQFLAEQESRNG